MLLTKPSPRPELLVDNAAHGTAALPGIIGMPGPWGRERVVFAVPTPPTILAQAVWLRDEDGFQIGDPQGNIIGVPRVIVHRMLAARWTEDTRRLAG